MPDEMIMMAETQKAWGEATPANGAGFDGFFGWVLIRVLLDGWKRVTL